VNFEQGDYSGAEKLYEQILTMHPDNLYALSNLGIVRMRSGKLKPAEDALKRAVAIAPGDAFSHCTLGIVYYVEGLPDRAMAELKRTLAIDPKNSAAREYISTICGGQRPRAQILPIGDFDTQHERELRQLPPDHKPSPPGEIGLPPSLP
jgi:predicted Zn-dependent protease